MVEFLDALNTVSLDMMDAVLGWLLRLPSDIAIIIVAVLTAGLMRVIRLACTDQSLLRRAAEDRATLRKLMRAAKARGDREAVRRYRNTKTMIALRTMNQEWKPLLFSILPVAILATWCFSRLDFHPPKADEPVTIAMYTPPSLIGEAAHIVPMDGLESEGWMRRINPDSLPGDKEPVRNGVVSWTIRGKASNHPYRMILRAGGRTLEHEVLIGGMKYSPTTVFHSDQWVTESRLRQVKFFGIVPGIPIVGFAPWLVGYLLIVCAVFPVLRRITGIN